MERTSHQTASAREQSGLRPPSPTRCLADSALHCAPPPPGSPRRQPPLFPSPSSAHGEAPFRMTDWGKPHAHPSFPSSSLGTHMSWKLCFPVPASERGARA